MAKRKSTFRYFMEVDDSGMTLYKVRRSNRGFVSWDETKGQFPRVKLDNELGPFVFYKDGHKRKFPFFQKELSKQEAIWIGKYLSELLKG